MTTAHRDEDAPQPSGRFEVVREDSRGHLLVRQIREAKPDSPEELELARKVAHADDMDEIKLAFAQVGDGTRLVAEGVAKVAKGGKLLAGALGVAMLGSPVVERLLPSRESEIHERLDRIEEGIDASRRDTVGLTRWMWEIEQAEKAGLPHPGPPPTVRLNLARDDIENQK